MIEWQFIEGDGSSYPMWYTETETDQFEIVDYGVNIIIFVNGMENESVSTIEEGKETIEAMITEGYECE